jgi:hypothetical protein
MGLDPAKLPDGMIKLDPSGELRKLRAKAAGHANAGLTQAEASAKALQRLERTEQRLLASWLMLKEEEGLLVYDWSRTDRRTTNRKGMPDFRIYRGGRVLFGEMKLDGARLSPDQAEVSDRFLRSGTEMEIWSSADVAIRRVRAWIWQFWRIWDNEAEPPHEDGPLEKV